MLRVRTIYARSAGAAVDYYTRYLTEAPGEIPGKWHGQQAAGLGLAGDVAADDLLAVLEGRDPRSGTPLGRAFADRQLRQRHDRQSGRRLRRHVLRTEVAERAVGAHPRHPTPRSTRHRSATPHSPTSSDSDRPHASGCTGTTPPPRLEGPHDRHVPTDDVTRRRPADPHPLASSRTRSRRMTAAGSHSTPRYLKKHQRDARRPLPVRAPQRTHPPLRHRLGTRSRTARPRSSAMPERPPRDLLEAHRRGRRRTGIAKIDDFVARQGRDPIQWEQRRDQARGSRRYPIPRRSGTASPI